MRKLFVAIVFISLVPLAFAEVVTLKSGKVIEGKIVEDADEFIKLETTDGQSLYFYKNTIANIVRGNQDDASITSVQQSLNTGLIDRLNEAYMLYVPKSVSQNAPSPILICLPGWGISAKQDINNWAFYAAKKGFIVVGLDVNYNLIGSGADVEALYSKILHTIEVIAAEYPVQKDKIFIAGTSAGGMMSIALALHYPDKFTGIGVVSGGRLGFGAEQDVGNARGLWFYMIHGKLDKNIPASEFSSTEAQLEKNGAIIEGRVVPEGEHTLSSSAYQETVEWLSKVK